MFKNLEGHGAQFIKSLILIVGIVGTALPAKAEIIHFESLDLTQVRSKNLDDPYERRFTAPNNMEITSIELKLSENRDSEPLAFSSVTISIDGSIFTYSSHNATAGTITLIGHAELSAYAEKDGPNAYHYMMQKVRHNHIGLRARINETFDFDLGDLKLTGEFGYQADLSESSKAQAYQLSDSRLIFTHDVSDKDEAYSSSHSMVSFGADLTGNNGWTYSAKGRLQKYKTGNIGSLSLQAAYLF